MNPALSLLIVNRDDPRIADTLEALTLLPAVRRQEAEVIVVDASNGRLAHIQTRYPQVRWIDFQPISGVITIAHQRNLGVAAAKGEIIVFIDTACLPAADWLDLVTKPIVTGGERIVAGASRSPGHNTLRDEAWNRIAKTEYLPEAPTINLAVHRSVFDRIGDFDERFAYGCDVDFTWRAVDAGFRIKYVPAAVVTHDWGAGREELRRTWNYGRARARLYLKHRNRWRDLGSRDLPLIVYPAYLLLGPLLVRRAYLHLALLIPLYRNRRHRPFATLVNHFIRAAAAIVEVSTHLGSYRRHPAEDGSSAH